MQVTGVRHPHPLAHDCEVPVHAVMSPHGKVKNLPKGSALSVCRIRRQETLSGPISMPLVAAGYTAQ